MPPFHRVSEQLKYRLISKKVFFQLSFRWSRANFTRLCLWASVSIGVVLGRLFEYPSRARCLEIVEWYMVDLDTLCFQFCRQSSGRNWTISANKLSNSLLGRPLPSARSIVPCSLSFFMLWRVECSCAHAMPYNFGHPRPINVISFAAVGRASKRTNPKSIQWKQRVNDPQTTLKK